jgi:hypothetical protein
MDLAADLQHRSRSQEGGHVKRIPTSGFASNTGPVPVLRGTAHFCGGCGAAFIVADFLTVLPVDLAGTAREFCACCLAFLGNRVPSSVSTDQSGYDEEGQALNVFFHGTATTERRAHRAQETQDFLGNVLRANAARLGMERPEPLFLSN